MRRLTAKVDVSYGDTGFSFNGSGLIPSNLEWFGWMGELPARYFLRLTGSLLVACHWCHGVPQLFWQYYFRDITLPSSYAKVELHKRTYEWLGRVGALTVQKSEYWPGKMRYFLLGIDPVFRGLRCRVYYNARDCLNSPKPDINE